MLRSVHVLFTAMISAYSPLGFHLRVIIPSIIVISCSCLRFCDIKDRARQGKKATAGRIAITRETANQTTASVSGSTRTGEGKAGRDIFYHVHYMVALKQAAGTPPVHATEKKDVTCRAGCVVGHNERFPE